MRLVCFALITVLFGGSLRADGPRDNIPDNVRPIPPIGIEVGTEDQAVLRHGLGRACGTPQAAEA